MTTSLIVAIGWYLGALVLLWHVSIRYRNGASITMLAPLFFAACLMLITASSLYYDYTDAPFYRFVSYAWYLVGVWVVYVLCAEYAHRIRR